jgi:hypothetical protein
LYTTALLFHRINAAKKASKKLFLQAQTHILFSLSKPILIILFFSAFSASRGHACERETYLTDLRRGNWTREENVDFKDEEGGRQRRENRGGGGGGGLTF